MSKLRHREVIDRVEHLYCQTDGSIEFPNSAEGDILKIAYRTAKALVDENALTPKQQHVLAELKHVYTWNHSHSADLIHYLLEKDENLFTDTTIMNFYELSEDDFVEVMALFTTWVMETEPNKIKE